jgi:GTP cyclohydrolase I
MNLKIEVRGINDAIREIEQDYHAFLERVASTVHDEAPKFTPKRTGKAAASWEKTVTKDNFEVTNTTDYAVYLEKPYVKSKKAPRGIIGPTLTSVKGKLR